MHAGGLRGPCLRCPPGSITITAGATQCGKLDELATLGRQQQQQRPQLIRMQYLVEVCSAPRHAQAAAVPHRSCWQTGTRYFLHITPYHPTSHHAGCRPGTGVSTLADPLAPGAAFQCDQCPIGTYSPGGSIAPCTRCPGSAFMVTPPAATRVSQCTCSPGGCVVLDRLGPGHQFWRHDWLGLHAAGVKRTAALPADCSGTVQLLSSAVHCLALFGCSSGKQQLRVSFWRGVSAHAVRCVQSTLPLLLRPPPLLPPAFCTGYGSTPDFPNSCQMCPIGTYADAVAQIIDIPGVPPQGGKGITGGLIGATIKPCKPCCPAGVGTCGYTTKQPGSRAFSDCVLAAPPAS